jgi:hypothetical protein
MIRFSIASLSLLLVLAYGCGPKIGAAGFGGGMNMDRMQQQQDLMQKLMSDPEVPTWHAQREKVTLAMGDRVFDKDFARVFDSITVALATLEANVNNMERQSGYITSAVPRLAPERGDQLHHAAMVDYCRYYHYDPSLLEKKGPYDVDVDMMRNFNRMGQAMTISLVKQGEGQTKVKIRFSNVNYPGELQEYYKVVWPAIDKQIFLDRNVD